MNIALSTVILFILLIPGLLFRRFYYTEEFSKEYFKQSFFGTFISAFIPSLIFHGIWFYLAGWLGSPINLAIIGELVSGAGSEQAYQNVTDNANKIFFYNVSVAVTAGFMGFVCKSSVRRLKLDRKYKLFRYQNSWHYILKGEFFDFPRASFELQNNNHDAIELTYLDALIDTSEGLILYEGILVDYELSAANGLDYVTLKVAKRKFIDTGKPHALQSNEIKGHIIILPFSQIKNINVSFYSITEKNGLVDIQLVE